MSLAELIEIERKCEQLSYAYARSVDFRDYDTFADLFTADGILDTGREMIGADTIRAAMNKRPDELRSRHVLTNIYTQVMDRDSARGISYLTLYRHIGPESLEHGPVAFDRPAAVGHYEDRFARTLEGWRFARRKLHLAFRNESLF
ncbi:MAG: nuclear transport factor 2 family protein [Pseudomonadales bacterium]|nr:nuclear transport factor 2 family protein [Pseudomonadales bacterium]MDP6471902.1 nuclear transport factor 2 family protein [Pseudomonadales bacterium]MDP6826828.1 nuclear transport factor 2 family protein [Pseudomonadales bacterium]MDP6970894.1 nuclear transport factor 2 family protein [Pseudomonadales bacterium]|tara:strand:- start:408 stop:845 length:438 start_codon:yes stop_codon:yes gene_type:complete